MFGIQGRNLSFKYEDSTRNILDGIDPGLNSGSRIGLIGKNGCGKTTLFKIILGELTGYQGQISPSENIRKGYLPQEIDFDNSLTPEHYIRSISEDLYTVWEKLNRHYRGVKTLNDAEFLNSITLYEELGGYSFDIELDKLLDRFDMPELDLSRKIGTFSGGEKTKFALIRILLNEPDILFLDEPTNHLDSTQLTWLEKFLKSIRIPFSVISHDRKFLDETVSEIWEIENGKMQTFSGNYSFYKTEKEKEFNLKIQQYETQQKKIKQLSNAQMKKKEWALTFQGETKAEGGGDTYECITNRGRKAMRRAKVAENRIERIIEKEKAERPFIEKERHITFDDPGIRSRTVLTIEGLSAAYEDKTVFENIDIVVNNGDRIAITGKNGSGKSTLLKVITAHLEEASGTYRWNPQVKIGYYAQEYEDLRAERTVLEEVIGSDKREQTRARIILGSLNISGDEVNRKVSILSSGERAKVSLAKIIFSDVNVLILDEPTNHLEISAREALEDALISFKGTVIFVSHDRYFSQKIGTKELKLK